MNFEEAFLRGFKEEMEKLGWVQTALYALPAAIQGAGMLGQALQKKKPGPPVPPPGVQG